MTETAFVRGEGGVVWEMDWPLNADGQKALKSGQLVRVNADGSPWTGTTEPAPIGDLPPGGDDEDPGDDGDLPPELASFLAEDPDPPVPAAEPKKATPRKAAKAA